MPTKMVAALLGAAVAAAVAWAGVACLQTGLRSQDLFPGSPLSSGDETSPVPFWWLLYPDSGRGGYGLLLQGGSIHAIADEVRLVDGMGGVVARVATEPAVDVVNPCMGSRGVLRAEIPLAEETGGLFASGWPSGYRVEALVATVWRDTELAPIDCPTVVVKSEGVPAQ